MDSGSKANIDWISDLVVKAFVGAITLLLGFAVHSLQSMNEEIKTLSHGVYELSSQGKVVKVTIDAIEKRLDKLEQAKENRP